MFMPIDYSQKRTDMKYNFSGAIWLHQEDFQSMLNDFFNTNC